MKELFALIVHLLTRLIKLARPGGVRAVAAELMALKHQLLVVHRTRKRALPMTLLPSSIKAFNRGLRDETTASSDMAKKPFSKIRKRMMNR